MGARIESLESAEAVTRREHPRYAETAVIEELRVSDVARLDRVRQSGPGPATHGHISKQGSVRARHALVEACRRAVRQPGPLHAFYERIRARRGHSVAVVAAARWTARGD